jgi:hypothetical protein
MPYNPTLGRCVDCEVGWIFVLGKCYKTYNASCNQVSVPLDQDCMRKACNNISTTFTSFPTTTNVYLAANVSVTELTYLFGNFSSGNYVDSVTSTVVIVTKMLVDRVLQV